MSDSSFWNEDWLKTQKTYWENWTEMSRRAMRLQEPARSPWESAMDHWWQAVSPSLQGMPKEFMEKMMKQGGPFFRMNEDVARQLDEGKDWMEAITSMMTDMQKQFENNISAFTNNLGTSGENDASSKLIGFWEMPMESWRKMADSLPGMFGDFPRNVPPHDLMARFLSAPGVGYTREQEAQYKEVTRCATDYQQALMEYARFFASTGIESVQRMKERVQEVTESGNSIDSARSLYDLWVSSSEEVYGRRVMTSEYAELHGRLVNALMALKQRLGLVMDSNLTTFNIPTRRELRTLQDRLQETRRENRTLRSELELLKEQVSQLHVIAAATVKKRRTTPATTRSPRKKVAKKKASAKRKTTD